MKREAIGYSQMVMPNHTNAIGTLFGGQMMSWLDIAAVKAAYHFLKDSEADIAVTRSFDRVEFRKPVFLGEWLDFQAKIIKTGKSSLDIAVSAYAESKSREKRLVCSATITMVAVKKDNNGVYLKIDHGKSI